VEKVKRFIDTVGFKRGEGKRFIDTVDLNVEKVKGLLNLLPSPRLNQWYL
jgi:hypothetical protein